MDGKVIKEVNKILVLCHHGMGDVIMCTPMLKTLGTCFPWAEIVCTVRGSEGEVLLGTGTASRCVKLCLASMSVAERAQFVWKIRRERFEVCIASTEIDEGLGAVLCWLSGASKRVGEIKGKGGALGRLYNYRIPLDVTKHRVLSNLDLIKALCPDAVCCMETQFRIETQDMIEAEDFLKSNGLSCDSQFVCIHPGCIDTQSSRRWPLERYMAVADYIWNKYRVAVVILGGPSEAGLIHAVESWSRQGLINGINKLSIGATASVIRRSRFIVGNDSGLMHIAGALKTPTVSLIAEHLAERTYPFNSENIIVVPKTKTMPKVLGIALEDVLGAVDGSFGGREGHVMAVGESGRSVSGDLH